MGCVRLEGAQEEPWLLSLFFCVCKSYRKKKKDKKKQNPTNQTQLVPQLQLDGGPKHSLARPRAAQMEILYGATDSLH